MPENNLFHKLLSGRFIATVLVTFSYCFIVVYTTIQYAGSLLSEPTKLEAFAVGLVMGFSGTAAIIIKSYFDRSDRQSDSDLEGKQ